MFGTDAMAVAEALCAERGQRLTPIRRKVLGTLLASHKPLGAYESSRIAGAPDGRRVTLMSLPPVARGTHRAP